MLKLILNTAIFCAALFGVRSAGARLAASPTPVFPDEAEVLLLPRPEAVRFLSFGYRNGLASILWFRTISYFGKHYATDARYPWLLDLCRLVTALTPEATHVYEFGSMMLSWEAHDPDAAYELLSEAMEQHPDDWKFPYLRGFVSLYFRGNNAAAKDDFVRSAQLPGAHPLVLRLATKDLSGGDGAQSAIDFIETMLKTGVDAAARRALEHRLMELRRAVGGSAPMDSPLTSGPAVQELLGER